MMHFADFGTVYLSNARPDCGKYQVYEKSVRRVGDGLVYMADAGDEDVLVACNVDVGFYGEQVHGALVAPLTHENACALRALFPYTAPSKVLSRNRTFGVGDRLGIASPGHIRVFEQCDVTPVLAQLSMRELRLTGRTYEDVIDAAGFSVFRAGYESGFGADGDHLKTMEEIEAALDVGCTMITLDCSDHIKAPSASKASAELEALYLNKTFDAEGEAIRFTPRELGEASSVYGDVIAFTVQVYNRFFAEDNRAQLEISIDETGTATTPQQHFFIASELHRLNVDFVTLAPRFVGEFQKGIDYIGDLADFEREFKIHAAIARHFSYKLSIHSGSDKFSVYPIIEKYVDGKVHVKTAGTNWLEAMRVVAQTDPGLYREAHALALRTFGEATKYYHVTTNLENIPPLEALEDSELPALFDQNDPRQLIHISYGFILGDSDLKRRLYALWRRERGQYSDALYRHIGKHIEFITAAPLREKIM